MARTKLWSRVVREAGVQVRVYERPGGAGLYRSVIINGKKDQKALGHSDRKRAVDDAKALARKIAEMQLTGRPVGEITFGELVRLYVERQGALLKPKRLHAVKRALDLLGRHLEGGGRPFRLDDFSQHHADTYAAARRSGALRSDDPRASRDGVRDGTIRNELQVLSAVCNWGVSYKVGGQRLLSHNPVRDVRLPAEKNPRRPVASTDRYRKLLAVADQVDRSGQFRLALVLAYHTARRIDAILHLRRSDMLLTPDQVRAGLAAAGMDEALADAWPQAIRWRAEWDKKGFESVAPISEELRREVEAYLRQHPRVGEAWLFEYARKEGQPTPKNAADWWLRQAEKKAKLPHLERGGWHAFRRAWASARRHLPVQDVMAAGGWRDVKALQTAYQQADARTVRAVVELAESA